MFVGEEVRLEVGFAVAWERLARLSETGALLGTSEDAYMGLARVGALGVSKLVRVQVRELSWTDLSAGLALRWEATGPGGGLFPVLDADLRLAPDGEGSVLTLAGAYRPPVEVKAYQAIDPLTIGAREIEFHYPTPAELAEVGPDNIARLTEHMISVGHLEEDEVAEIRKEVEAVVEDAVQYSLASAQPTMDEAWRHLTCNRRHERLLQA